MLKIPAAVLSFILALQPALLAAQSTAAEAGQAPAPSEELVSKEEKVLKLVELLKSFSDDEYEAALSQVPEKAKSAELASRGAVLKSAYKTLAGIELKKAGVEGQAPQETGREMDVLKWLANAGLNYWLSGGQTFVGRELKADSAAEKSLAGLNAQLSGAEISPEKKVELHRARAEAYEKLSEEPDAVESPEERIAKKAERLKKLADLLSSVSNEDYQQALKALPAQERGKNLSSRGKVLNSAYVTLSALEYRQAAQAAPEGASTRYLEAYARVKKENASSLALDPETLQETGLALDIFKFVGNAALNYWLKGGEDFLSGGAKGRGGPVQSEEAGAKLGPGAQAERHYEQGAQYEQWAADALKGENEDVQAARKAERLKKLAQLLESISEEEYADVVKELPADSPARPHLASRSKLLTSAYTSLAALEYRAASREAPKESQAPYQAELERVSRDGAKDLALNPQTLQETGWATNLLSLFALGGIGYAVYEHDRRNRGSSRSNPSSPGSGSGQTAPSYDGLRVLRWRSNTNSGLGTLNGCASAHNVAVSGGRFSVIGNQCGTAITTSGSIDSSGVISGDVSGIGFGSPFSFAGSCSSKISCAASGNNSIGSWSLELAPFTGETSCGDGMRPRNGVCVNIGPLTGCPASFSRVEISADVQQCLNSGNCVYGNQPTVDSGAACIKRRAVIIPSNNTVYNQALRPSVMPSSSVQYLPYSCLGQRRNGKVECIARQSGIINPAMIGGCPNGVDAYCLEHIIATPEQLLLLENSGARTLVSRQAAQLYQSVDGLENQLASAETGAVKAGLHQQLGVMYERLAQAAAPKPAQAPAEEAPKAAPVEIAPVKPVAKAEEPARKPEPKRAPAPAAQDTLLLWDGSRLEGEISAASQDKIVIKTGAGMTGVRQERIWALILRASAVDVESENLDSGELPLILKADGTSLRGRLVAASARQLSFKTEDGVASFARGDIRGVLFPGKGKKPR